MVYLSIDNLKYKLILKRENEKNRSVYYHTFDVVFVLFVGFRFVWAERGYHVVLLPSVLAPKGTLRSRGDCGRQAVYHGRGQDGDYRQPHREDEDHHPQGLPCSQFQGSIRQQHRGDPLA